MSLTLPRDDTATADAVVTDGTSTEASIPSNAGRVGRAPAGLRLVISHPCRLTCDLLVASLTGTEAFGSIRSVLDRGEVLTTTVSIRAHVALIAGVIGEQDLAVASQVRQHSGCGVVLVATEPSRAIVDAAFRTGTVSLLSHNASLPQLVHVLRGAAMGCTTVDAHSAPDGETSARSPLNPREREVLFLTAEGIPIKDIATRLYLTPGTVRNISSSAIRKLSARNRNEAVRLAHAKGWL